MAPDFQNGDIAICLTVYPKKFLKIGQVIIFNHPEFGVMIKKIAAISKENQTLYVRGNNLSTNSEDIGAISFENIIGRVLKRIKK